MSNEVEDVTFEAVENALASPWTKQTYSEPTEDSEDAPRGTWLDSGDGRGNSLPAIKYRINKSNVISSFESYVEQLLANGKPDVATTEALFDVVSKFALVKINKQIWKFADVGAGADAFANDVVVKVIEGLDDFKGNGANFYSWLHRICFTTACDSYHEVRAEFKRNAPLFITDEDGDEGDNPALYEGDVIHEPARQWPIWLEGTDLLICKLIVEGLRYKQISKELGLTQDALLKRAQRISTKARHHNLPQQRVEFLKERDRIWARKPKPKSDRELLMDWLQQFDSGMFLYTTSLNLPKNVLPKTSKQH